MLCIKAWRRYDCLVFILGISRVSAAEGNLVNSSWYAYEACKCRSEQFLNMHVNGYAMCDTNTQTLFALC